VTDIWDDIRELTSGYLAGAEPIRVSSDGLLFSDKGERFYKQQDPIALAVRIILASTVPSNLILDPFAGTGTFSIVAEQLGRRIISIEKNPRNVACIRKRHFLHRKVDDLSVRKYKFGAKFKTLPKGRYSIDSVKAPEKRKKE